MKAFLSGLTMLLVALPATAQVGHLPATSPYVDLEYSMELTPMFGVLRTRPDPAGIAPRGGAIVGVRYEWTLTGPLALSSDLIGGMTTRDVIDPTKPRATRELGTENKLVTAFDVALALNLTGQKSWNGLVPQLRAGLGFVGSAAKDESSGFAFGTPFAISWGGGVKYLPGGRWQLRADLTDRLFKLSYPDSYYRTTSDNTAVLDASADRSFYTHHTALTVGVSYLFAR